MIKKHINKFVLLIFIIQSIILFVFYQNQAVLNTQINIVESIDKVKPCVVGINVKQIKRNNNIWSPFFDSYLNTYKVDNLGSGVIISPDGYVITNSHVVDNALEITVTLVGGKRYSGKIIGIDHLTDLALIKIEGDDLSYAELGKSDDLIVGESVFALGNPLGLFSVSNQPTATLGIISGVDIDFGLKDHGYVYQDMIQTDAAINRGNSGGPLVNLSGQVIGINTFIMTDSDYASGSIGIGFAIPIKRVKEVIEDIKVYGRVRRNYTTGIHVQPVDKFIMKYLRLENQKGVLIRDVEKYSPGYEAALKVGDIILTVQGQNVNSAKDITEIIDEGFHKVGDIVKLMILRNGEKKEIDLELGDPEQNN
ncbi:MAG: 2-alkenal reductase [Candidatus Marinimicrobia bacterium]|nr:2-alkenal reductase [Candidatus Neomarinimicrobiota bacterium]